MASKKAPTQTQDALKELDTLGLQKHRVSTELIAYTTLLASPADEPVIITDMAPYLNFLGLADKISVKYPYSSLPSDVRAQQKPGGKAPGGFSSSAPSVLANTHLIFPPFVSFQSNLQTLALVPGEQLPPSATFNMVKEASFVRTFTVDTFSSLYSRLLVYDVEDSQFQVPKELTYSLSSFRIFTLVPFLINFFEHYSVSAYFQGKDPARDLLVASPLDMLVPGTKEKPPTVFTTINISKHPVYLPIINYASTQTSSSTSSSSVDPKATEDANAYYYHPHVIDVEVDGVKYRCTANWANILAMCIDSLSMNPYKFLLQPFSRLMPMSIPFDDTFCTDSLRLFLHFTNKTLSPNMVTFIEFPTLFGVIRDRIRKHFLLSENLEGSTRNALLHKLIDDVHRPVSQHMRSPIQRESPQHAEDSSEENSRHYSLNLNDNSHQDDQYDDNMIPPGDMSLPITQKSYAEESKFLLDLFDSVISEEARLQVPLSLGVMDVLIMETTDYNTKSIFSRSQSKLQKENGDQLAQGTTESVLKPSPKNINTGNRALYSLRSIIDLSDSSLHNSSTSTDSSPFDALEEHNLDTIFVKLWVSDPVLAVVLSDTLTEYEEDFVQTYSIERQLKLYRMIEKKHPNKYNNGRYNVGSTEGASASGPIIIATATDASGTLSGMNRVSCIGDDPHNISVRNSGIGSHAGIPASLQFNNTMVSHTKHGHNMSIYTGRTTRTKMTAKEVAERRRLLKLEAMRSKLYECNQNYLPGRKIVMYKDYDPENFPLGKPDAPWNNVNKEEKPIDILSVDLATIRTMDPNELTTALDTQERMMKTVSLLPRLRECTGSKQGPPTDKHKSVASSVVDREFSVHSNNISTHQDPPGNSALSQGVPTLSLGNLPNNSLITPRQDQFMTVLDAPGVQIGPYIEEEQHPKKTKHHKKQKSIRGYRIIDETASYAAKTHIYDTITCDVGADDSLFEDDEDEITVPMNYCVLRLSTLLELSSGALVLNLEHRPKPLCDYKPYVPVYAPLSGDTKGTIKRSPSANKTATITSKPLDSRDLKIQQSNAESAELHAKDAQYDKATIERPIWRPKLISYDSPQLTTTTKQPVKVTNSAINAKRPQQPVKQTASQLQEDDQQNTSPDIQIDGFGKATLTNSNVLNTASTTVIGDKDKMFLPTIKKVQTLSMLPTIQLYQMSVTIVRKHQPNELQQPDEEKVHRSINNLIDNESSLNVISTHLDMSPSRSHPCPDTLLADFTENASEKMNFIAKIAPSKNVHWGLDNWLSSESLLISFNAEYHPVILQDSSIASKRENSSVSYMEIVFYFLQDNRLFERKYRGFSTLTLDIIKEYCANTRLSSIALKTGIYKMSILFSISIHSVFIPHPLTIIDRFMEGRDLASELINKAPSRAGSADSQTRGPCMLQGIQDADKLDYWEIDPFQENLSLLEKQIEVNLIEARFHMNLLPSTQHCHGANITVSALQHYTGETGISNVSIVPYEPLQDKEASPRQDAQQSTDSHLPLMFSQSLTTQGVLSKTLSTVAAFILDGPESIIINHTPIATAPAMEHESATNVQGNTNMENHTDNVATIPLGEGITFSKKSDATFIRLLSCFDEGIPANTTLYLYVLDSNSDVLFDRTPICVNGLLMQTKADLIIPTQQKTFVLIEGFSTYQPISDPKAKSASPTGLLPFKFTLDILADATIEVKPLLITSNTFQLRTPLTLNFDEKTSIELKFSLPTGYCYLEIGLITTQEVQSPLKLQEVPTDEKSIAPDSNTIEEVQHNDSEGVILPVNIFNKPLLPMFEQVQNTTKGKTSPQKKPLEEDFTVKANNDIREVLKSDAIRMNEHTATLAPVLCSGCLVNNKRVYIISIPPSGVIAINTFIPDGLPMNTYGVSMHFRAYTFQTQDEASSIQVDAKGKQAEPQPNTISICQTTLNEWVLQRLCTSIWSRTRVLQGEELLGCANYLSSAAQPQSITTKPSYSFVPTDELIAYIEKAEEKQSKVATTDKKSKTVPQKKKETEVTTRIADPLELTLGEMQIQERDDLSQLIAAEVQALQTFTVSLGTQQVDRKQPQAKKPEVKRDKNMPEPTSTIVNTFQKKLINQRTQAAIEYFDVEVVTKKARKNTYTPAEVITQ